MPKFRKIAYNRITKKDFFEFWISVFFLGKEKLVKFFESIDHQLNDDVLIDLAMKYKLTAINFFPLSLLVSQNFPYGST